MPKETYKNLPYEKKNLILQVAIDEFYEYGYEKSSISRIVKLAGIAKGSFYQYFEGKEDLFRLVMDTASEKKLTYLKNNSETSSKLNLFDLLKVLYLSALSFLKENPKLASITDGFLKSSDSILKEIILGDSIKKSNLFLENLLNQAIIKKEVRSDIDISFTAHLLTGLSISLSDYMRAANNDYDEKSYYLLVDQTINLIRMGIEAKSDLL